MNAYKNNNETEFIFDGGFNPYTVVNNYIFEDETLSMKAKGLYCSIVRWQNSPSHVITVAGLTKTSKDGKDSIKSALRELIEHGFLSTIQLRDDKGHFKGILYRVYAKPIDVTSETIDTQCIEPRTEKAVTVNPTTDNPPHKRKISKKKNIKNYNINDDKSATSEVKEHHQSSKINEELVDRFLKEYSSVMNKQFILSRTDKIAITNLSVEYGEEAIFVAINNIKNNQYLLDNNSPYFFVKCFANLYNNTYVKRTTIPSVTVTTPKKTRFNTMDSRTWDFDELDRLEREYIERKLQETKEKSHPQVKNKEERYIKQQQELTAKYNKSNYFEAYKKGEINISEYEILKSHFEKLENKIVEDITPCDAIEETEDTKVENIEIGGIELEEIEDVVGTETVKQLCFGESKKENTLVLTEREQALVARYRDMSAVTMAYVRKELTDHEYQFLHQYYNKPNYRVF